MGNMSGAISMQRIQCSLFVACIVMFGWAFMLRSAGVSIPEAAGGR